MVDVILHGTVGGEIWDNLSAITDKNIDTLIDELADPQTPDKTRRALRNLLKSQTKTARALYYLSRKDHNNAIAVLAQIKKEISS